MMWSENGLDMWRFLFSLQRCVHHFIICWLLVCLLMGSHWWTYFWPSWVIVMLWIFINNIECNCRSLTVIEFYACWIHFLMYPFVQYDRNLIPVVPGQPTIEKPLKVYTPKAQVPKGLSQPYAGITSGREELVIAREKRNWICYIVIYGRRE